MTVKAARPLHDAMHHIPGMPAHGRARELNSRSPRAPHSRNRHPQPANRNARHNAPPRVLVAWQNWIGGLVRRHS
jgi:hypothetical protein